MAPNVIHPQRSHPSNNCASNPLPPVPRTTATSPPHDSFTRTIARFLRTKKLPSTCPKLLRQQLSCDAWRGSKGTDVPLRYRDCENGTNAKARQPFRYKKKKKKKKETTIALLQFYLSLYFENADVFLGAESISKSIFSKI